jgi:hypothetical protein
VLGRHGNLSTGKNGIDSLCVAFIRWVGGETDGGRIGIERLVRIGGGEEGGSK